MEEKEIISNELNPDKFIEEKVSHIKEKVADGIAINALSGGVDSSAVTILGHKALGNREPRWIGNKAQIARDV